MKNYLMILILLVGTVHTVSLEPEQPPKFNPEDYTTFITVENEITIADLKAGLFYYDMYFLTLDYTTQKEEEVETLKAELGTSKIILVVVSVVASIFILKDIINE